MSASDKYVLTDEDLKSIADWMGIPLSRREALETQTAVIWQALIRKFGEGSIQCNAFVEVCRMACITIPDTPPKPRSKQC